jgi:hypothetical protein
LVTFAALGAFLWKGGLGLLPTERTLVWKIPGEFASIRRVELQLYRGEVLLQREDLKTPHGLGEEPTQKVLLRAGKYRARWLMWREGSPEPVVRAAEVEVGDAEALVVQPGP